MSMEQLTNINCNVQMEITYFTIVFSSIVHGLFQSNLRL